MLKYLLFVSVIVFIVVACAKKDTPAPSTPTDEQIFRGKFTNVWWSLDSVYEFGGMIRNPQQAIMFCSGDSFLNKDMQSNKITKSGQKWHYLGTNHIKVDGKYSNSHATDTYLKSLASHYCEMDLDSGTGVYAMGYLSK